MESARNAVSSFLGQGGKQTTDVDENVNPAVTSETIKPHRHEETREAVDREIHQDHYHTTVQPVQHRETLPEQHQHQVAPQIEREYHHGNEQDERQRAEAELGQFKDSRRMEQTTQSSANVPSMAGEHTHHHVHEVVQPVIHKETVQPEFVHTTIPIHERHTAPSEHHGMSQLPTKTLDEMRGMGTPLEGGVKHHEEYEGHPKPYNPKMQLEREPVDEHPELHEGTHDPEATGHFKHGHSHGSTAASGLMGATGTRDVPATTGSEYGTGLGSGTTGAGMQEPIVGSGGTTAYDEGYRQRQEMGDPQGLSGSGYGAAPVAGAGLAATGLAAGGSQGGYDPSASSFTGDNLGERGLGSSGYGSSGLDGRDAAMGSGVGGVAGGPVAQDLGRDHTLAHQVGGLDRNDMPGSFGDSRPSAVGTALGGRAEGNTPNTAYDEGYKQRMEMGDRGRESTGLSPAEQQGSERQRSREPSNLAGGAAEPRGEINADDGQQHASLEGQDPSLQEKSGGKLTGSGTDGSHSAVFGLTPDGHKFNDTKKTTTEMPKAREGETPSAPGGIEEENPSENTAAKRGGSGGVADQMHDPRVAEKGHEGQASYGDGGEKPGAGPNTDNII